MTGTPKSAAETYSLQGLNQLAAGSPNLAIGFFASAIAEDHGFSEARHGLIRALRDAGRLEEAVQAARALTSLTPNDPLAYSALSICLQQAGQIAEAEAAGARARVLEWKAQLESSASGEPAR